MVGVAIGDVMNVITRLYDLHGIGSRSTASRKASRVQLRGVYDTVA